MIVLIHVIIAISSIVFSGYTFFSPSKNKLKISGLLITLTLGSGTYLVIRLHANMVSSCLSGLMYLTLVTAATIGAYRKLENKNQIIN
jgi:hypothetical protein